jgi:transposase-like protein
MACLLAIGVAATGERRVLGLDLAAGNDEGNAWSAFVRGLLERGLAGTRLIISDAQRGIVEALRSQLLGASWQRCRVHATRNALDLVPRGSQDMVAAAIRSIFEQPDETSASEQLRRVADGLSARFPMVSELLLDGETDLLVHFTFPEAHRRQIRSTDESVKPERRFRGGTRVTAQAKSGVPGMSALPRSRRLGARESLPSCGARVPLPRGTHPPGRDEAPVLLLGASRHGPLLRPDGPRAGGPAAATATA